MNEEKELTQQESIALITSMINKARNRFGENGFLYLLWGWVVLFCSLFQFASIYYFDFQEGNYIWLLTWLLIIYQIFYLRKRKRTQPARTYMDETQGWVWIAFVACLFLMFYICGRAGQEQLIGSFILLLYGMPLFLSGALLRFPPLIWGGVAAWVLAFISTFIPVEFHSLLVSLSLVVGWIIPGYLLRAKFRKTEKPASVN